MTPEEYFWQFVINVGASILGAFLGFLFALIAYDYQKDKNEKTRKNELVSHIEKEIDDIIKGLENPTKFNSEFVEYYWDETNKLIMGGHLNVQLSTYEYVMHAESLGLFSYDILDSLSVCKIGVDKYNDLIDDIHQFDVRIAGFDDERSKRIANALIDKEKADRIRVIENLKTTKEKIDALRIIQKRDEFNVGKKIPKNDLGEPSFVDMRGQAYYD